jgi:glycerol 2-dehydrogenase (NADP+)
MTKGNVAPGTETAVGRAIHASGIPRTDIFVTTKLAWHHASRVEESINDSLQKSGLEYFDLVGVLETYS